jgi:hypothetical protein
MMAVIIIYFSCELERKCAGDGFEKHKSHTKAVLIPIRILRWDRYVVGPVENRNSIPLNTSWLNW